jgi:hypothetical protein
VLAEGRHKSGVRANQPSQNIGRAKSAFDTWSAQFVFPHPIVVRHGATVRARLSMLAIDLVDLAAITLRVGPYKVYRV